MTSTPDLTRLSDVGAEDISWLWLRRLARGKLTLIAGDPGLGKSRVTFDICARITTGAPWPDGSGRATKGSVLLMLAEDGLGDTVRPAIDAMGGNPDGVFVLNVKETTGGKSSTRPADLSRDLADIEKAIEDLGPQLLVIDPLTGFLGSKVDSYKDSEVRSLLAPLLALIEKHRVALLVVNHLSKNAQKSALYRPGGSIAFIASARLAFAVAADPDDERRRIIAPLKANICQPAPSLAFTLPDGCVAWEAGTVNVSADALLSTTGPAPTRQHHALDAATDFLRQLLADGPVPSETVFADAKKAGITPDTLRRAKDALSIKPQKRGVAGGWIWALPTEDGHQAAIHRNVIPIFEDTYPPSKNLPIFEDTEDVEDGHLNHRESPRIPILGKKAGVQ
jgi:hypothetical protein